ncbi:aminopeptidase P family protein [Aquabacter spiritensis]|uniref:Xaa-Pro aminopeptidase n=1 Tax=Aquabacter spiritensis TaxID=933073 RepID=A0A4R3LNZ5_9HYPH|nr:aminopeptidase P family protein [Aquabacter spiritensis]TCT02082.1 Xaa-Pro aminopeptidase [Aquabacter spiritensis]
MFEPPPASPDTAPAARRFTARFQSFDTGGDGRSGGARLAALRAELARRGVQGYVIPRADAHQNEYVAPSEERLAYLTGFTGSAGMGIVLPEQAALFVDGRYTLQAAAQIDGTAFGLVPLARTSPESWIEKHLPKSGVLAFDPWRTTLDGRDKLSAAVSAAGGMLVALEQDPFDAIWPDRPAAARAPVRLVPDALSGEASAAKLDRVRAALGDAKVNLALISDPHAVAWLFNLRGGDVAHTPIALAWAIVPAEGRPVLFLAANQVPASIRPILEAVADIAPASALEAELARRASGKTVRLDQATAPVQLACIIERAGGTVAKGADPCALLKAVKNPAEIAGMRAAHERDGLALARFLHWFSISAPGNLTEIDIVEALETFRREGGGLNDVSFPTISGAGPNGAIVHYRVTRETNRALQTGELFLVDSGAQYDEGTTDVTRTLAVGTPSAEMRVHYTLVLKGHIAVSRAVFPEGTTGAQIDPFARQFLWANGLDYDHGTGHGVGAGLSVHEGPARLSKLGHVALKAGMILSNEPGYYRTGAYGIRIENLVLVEPRHPGGDRPSLGFSTLTLAPYERSLIETALLTPEERTWIDTYHAEVAARLAPKLDPGAAAWLLAATAPLG